MAAQKPPESNYLGATQSVKGVWSVDFAKMARMLLSTFLRKPILSSFPVAGMKALTTIYNDLLAFRGDKINQMSYNSQVCYLRKMLNDKFDPYQRRIRIGNGEIKNPLWIYREIEEKPVFLGTVMLNRADVISFSGEFVVYIPISLQNKIAEIRAWLDYYKLVTRYYTVKFI